MQLSANIFSNSTTKKLSKKVSKQISKYTYTVSQKTFHYTFVHKLNKMLTDFWNPFTVRISEKFAIKFCNISHQTLNVFLHYLAKCKCSYIIIFRLQRSQNIWHQNRKFFFLKLISILWAAMVSFTVIDDGFRPAKIILTKEDKALSDKMSVLKG